jgi:hypothetical protein
MKAQPIERSSAVGLHHFFEARMPHMQSHIPSLRPSKKRDPFSSLKLLHQTAFGVKWPCNDGEKVCEA